MARGGGTGTANSKSTSSAAEQKMHDALVKEMRLVVREEIYEEVKKEVLNELKVELRRSLKHEIRADMEEEITAIKNEIIAEVVDPIIAEIKTLFNKVDNLSRREDVHELSGKVNSLADLLHTQHQSAYGQPPSALMSDDHLAQLYKMFIDGPMIAKKAFSAVIVNFPESSDEEQTKAQRLCQWNCKRGGYERRCDGRSPARSEAGPKQPYHQSTSERSALTQQLLARVQRAPAERSKSQVHVRPPRLHRLGAETRP
jgi:predicted HAD superfamily Cof-like phosphohydrolase